MRRKSIITLFVAAFLTLGVSVAGAYTTLFEYQTSGGTADLSTFDTGTGLGSLALTISGTGSHFGGLFVDHELSESVNTFFNEYGATGGALGAGQSWEIDEPGYVFGNIYTNFVAGALDNSNGVPGTAPDDVSMALGWNFDLLAGQTATITFLLSDTAPGSGFYLAQFDPDSGENIYFSSSLDIRGGGPEPVPEPSTILLLGAGLFGMAASYARKKRKD